MPFFNFWSGVGALFWGLGLPKGWWLNPPLGLWVWLVGWLACLLDAGQMLNKD